MRIPLILLALAGCAGTGASPTAGEGDALSRELAGRVAGEAESCVTAGQSSSLRAVDRQTLVYREGRTLWVNRLRSACPGIAPMNTLIVEVKIGRYCRGDFVRGLEPGANIPGPTCVLGDFVPYRRPE